MKKNIFRIAAVLCSIIMIFALVACNKGNTTDNSTKTSTPASTVASTETPASTVTSTDTPESVETPTSTAPVEKAKYTVTFNSNGGSAVASAEVEEGSTVAAPADPAKEGFTFVCWTTDEAGTAEYNFDTAVSGNITLYAFWEENETTPSDGQKTATFDVNYEGGQNQTVQYAGNNSRITYKPTKPDRGENYIFLGWFDESGAEFKNTAKYTGDVTFTAKWLARFTLEAEDTQFTDLPEDDETANDRGAKIGHNRSGDMSGTALISGYYVHGLYYNGAYLQFEINVSEAVDDAQIWGRFACEYKDYNLTEADLGVYVNGKLLTDEYTIELEAYDLEGRSGTPTFKNFKLNVGVALEKGDNVIRLVVLNDVDQFGNGTVYAAAPMVDCLYLYVDEGTTVTMTKYNG